MERWPNFFIVGTAKAGTTSLYEYLKKIPHIYLPSVKEPNYFSHLITPENGFNSVIHNKKKYLKLFDKANPKQIVGEASASYLSDPFVALSIFKILPNSKIIISLRDPVERLYSAYQMLKQGGLVKPTFFEQLQMEIKYGDDYGPPRIGLNYGLYHNDVRRYLEIFGKKQVKIIIFEEFIDNISITIQELLNFLGINYNINVQNEEIHRAYMAPRSSLSQFILGNKTISCIAANIIPEKCRSFIKKKILLKKQDKPLMLERDRQFLIKYYFEDVKQLKQLLGRNLPWKNFQS